MADNRATLTQIYEAFGRGDIPFILDQLAEDVRWEEWDDWSPHGAGVPWLRSGRGKEAAVAFFQVIGGWEFLEFEVRDLLGSETQVAAEVRIAVRLPSGATLRDEELHLWTFDDAGKVTRFRHYVDTAKHIAAARSETTQRERPIATA